MIRFIRRKSLPSNQERRSDLTVGIGMDEHHRNSGNLGVIATTFVCLLRYASFS